MSHAETLARHRAVLPAWLALYYDEPIELVDGKGNRVRDAEGQEYLDFFAGILTNMIGYNVPEVVEAVRDQAGRIVHSSTLYLISQQVELAEKISRLSGIRDAKVFFTSSGTEANEAALLFATTWRRSNQVLAIRNSYHGRSFGTIAVTGNRSWSASSYSGLQVSYVHGGYRYRSPYRDLPDEQFTAACVADLRDVIMTQTAGDVACMIAEPVQGVGGFATPPDGFFGAFKAVLDETGILFVSDEVQTAWGRTGSHFWGIQAHGVVPDMMTFAKGLAGGYAIGGVVGRPEIIDAVTVNSISTFGGNPLSTRAANAVLDYVLSHDLQAQAAATGAIIMAGMREAAAADPAVGDVRGKGLMVGVELVRPGTTTPDPAAASRTLEETRRRGLLIGKGGLHGNVLRIAPPLTLTPEEAVEGVGILRDAITAATAATAESAGHPG